MRNYFCIFASLIFFTNIPAYADDVISTFDPTTGVLELTNLHIDDSIYYVRLILTDAETLDFEVEAASALDITPDPTVFYIARAEDIMGTWRAQDGIDISFTFGPGRAFSMTQGPGLEDACPNGGSETGIFLYTPGTWLFQSYINSDENGDCGTSPRSREPVRMFIDGNTLRIFAGSVEGITLIRDE